MSVYHPQMAALVAFFVSLFLSLAKGIVWVFSGSNTLLASLSDSIQDCVLSATNFLAIRYADRPADNDHRYGHGKMEGIAALAQAAFIMGACVFIVLDSIRAFAANRGIEHPQWVVGVTTMAILFNLCLVIYQNKVLKSSGSLAVEADRAHYIGDIGIHASVIVAVLVDIYFNLAWADPVLGVGIALWLGWIAINIGKKAVDMLMDKELPASERDAIKAMIVKTRGVKNFHDLRTHKSGRMILMSFDIEIEASLSFHDAHNIAKRVEDRLHAAYPCSEIMIHMDPCGDIVDSRHKRIKHYHVK